MIGAEVSLRLAKIVPMLGSSVDAEALAAARAIGRVLDATDADWHDLAQALSPRTLEDMVADWAKAGRPAPQAARRTPEPREEPPPPFRDPSPYDAVILGLSATFRSTYDSRDTRRRILDMLSIEGAPISADEVTYLQLIADECYRRPHVELDATVNQRLDAIRRRVIKFLFGKLEAAS